MFGGKYTELNLRCLGLCQDHLGHSLAMAGLAGLSVTERVTTRVKIYNISYPWYVP